MIRFLEVGWEVVIMSNRDIMYMIMMMTMRIYFATCDLELNIDVLPKTRLSIKGFV